MSEKQPRFMNPVDCDACNVIHDGENTTSYQAKRCRDCKRNPALQFFPKKHVHDHFEAME